MSISDVLDRLKNQVKDTVSQSSLSKVEIDELDVLKHETLKIRNISEIKMWMSEHGCTLTEEEMLY